MAHDDRGYLHPTRLGRSGSGYCVNYLRRSKTTINTTIKMTTNVPTPMYMTGLPPGCGRAAREPDPGPAETFPNSASGRWSRGKLPEPAPPQTPKRSGAVTSRTGKRQLPFQPHAVGRGAGPGRIGHPDIGYPLLGSVPCDRNRGERDACCDPWDLAERVHGRVRCARGTERGRRGCAVPGAVHVLGQHRRGGAAPGVAAAGIERLVVPAERGASATGGARARPARQHDRQLADDVAAAREQRLLRVRVDLRRAARSRRRRWSSSAGSTRWSRARPSSRRSSTRCLPRPARRRSTSSATPRARRCPTTTSSTSAARRRSTRYVGVSGVKHGTTLHGVGTVVAAVQLAVPGVRPTRLPVRAGRATSSSSGPIHREDRGAGAGGRRDLHEHRHALRRAGEPVHEQLPHRAERHQHHAAGPLRARLQRPPLDHLEPDHRSAHPERARPAHARPAPCVPVLPAV